jgi:hypothetical protein
MNKKEKLIAQAKRVGIKFSGYYGLKEENVSIDELKTRIANRIKNERDKFKEFLSYSHIDILKSFVDEMNKENTDKEWYYKTSYFEAFKEAPDCLYEYDSDEDYDHHRWISYFSATKCVGDKKFGYTWATSTGDGDLEDGGFYVNGVWDGMYEIDPKDDITDKEVLFWLIREVYGEGNVIAEAVISEVKDEILKEQK